MSEPDGPPAPAAVPPDDAEARTALRLRGFLAAVPHNQALGLAIVEIGVGVVALRLPYDLRLVGNPETGVLHGGAITSLLDACAGAAVLQALTEPMPVATLDLRIDYLRPAEPGRDVVGRATCYKLTRNVAFVRALAYHDDESNPIASAAGTFMVGTRQGARPPGGGA